MSLTNRDLWIDPSETEREGTKLFGHLLLFTLIVIVVVGLVWAHYAVLDEITRGEGKVVPSGQTQVIQSVKGGKIKLVWNGPKPTAPVQLVVQGEGDYQTALFDVAGGKEVEVPAANYRVIWGRMMIGKGPRSQVASTSDRMWVESKTVLFCASRLMSSRISTICAGSRPVVGSSRIRTSGSWMIAWASPTRWR